MPIKKDKIKTIAIGNFDGMHIAHQELFKRLDDKNSALIVIDKDKATLTPCEQRQKYTKIPCILYEFKQIKALGGQEFIEILKKDFINLEKIVVGYDFKFGNNKTCNTDDLKQIFKKEVEVVPEVFKNGISVHSSVIREFLQNGDIKKANEFLGRFYSLDGKVIRGQGIGKKELFATLNLEVKRYFLPQAGVYATFCKFQNKSYKSVSFIGNRLSTDGAFSIETHILHIDELPKISELEVYFVDKIRDNAKFNNLKDLKQQISEDITKASKILERVNV